MKNLLFGALIGLIAFGTTGCGDDDVTCPVSDWLGTYSLQTEAECVIDDSTTAEAEPELVITEGTVAGSLSIDGQDGVVDADACTATAFFIVLTKNGDEIISRLGTCEWTYKKN